VRKKVLVLNLIFILVFLTLAPRFIPVSSSPYLIYNDGVGIGPLPIEVGMTAQIIGGYSLQYDPVTEQGYAVFILRNSTDILFENISFDQEVYTQKYIDVSIDPKKWSPGSGGQLGFVELNLFVETQQGTYSDNSSVWFYVQRASPKCDFINFTFLGDNKVYIAFELYNEHNSTYKIENITVNTKVYFSQILMVENISKTGYNGIFGILIEPEYPNQKYDFEIFTSENEDYVSNQFQFSLEVDDLTSTPNPNESSILLPLIISSLVPVIIGSILGYKRIKRKKDIELI
jgi:hypothetical protein